MIIRIIRPFTPLIIIALAGYLRFYRLSYQSLWSDEEHEDDEFEEDDGGGGGPLEPFLAFFGPRTM